MCIVGRRFLGTVKATKVKAHADDEMVRLVVVRALDKDGNDRADAAANRGGRRRVVLDVRRLVTQSSHLWCPTVFELHRISFGVGRTVVDDDGRGGIAINPVVWSPGAMLWRLRWERTVCNYAWPPGPDNLCWPGARVTPEDAPAWLHKLISSLSNLHSPAQVENIGSGGSLTLIFFSCMSFGLGSDWFLSRLFLSIVGKGASFLSRLFRWVFTACFAWPSRWYGDVHANVALVPTVADHVMLDGTKAVMGSRFGTRKQRNPFWMSLSACFVIILVWVEIF